MNTVTLIGNLVGEVSRRQLQSGTITSSFKLAVDRPKQMDREKEADFIWIETWNGVAEACATYLGSGDLVGVNGAIKTSSRKNEDGSFTNYFSVNARNVQFLRTKQREHASEAPPAVEASSPAPADADFTPSDDDIPF